jgi:hypothetical protein
LTGYEIVFFVALLATALALGGALAHALELPNKIRPSRDEYFIVQKAYRGWDQLAYLSAVQLMSIVAVAVMSRQEPRVLWPTIFAALFWTAIAENWETLRRQWEVFARGRRGLPGLRHDLSHHRRHCEGTQIDWTGVAARKRRVGKRRRCCY